MWSLSLALDEEGERSDWGRGSWRQLSDGVAYWKKAGRPAFLSWISELTGKNLVIPLGSSSSSIKGDESPWDEFPLGKERKVKLLSRVWLFATPRTVAYQAPLSMGFSRQEYWHGLPFLFSIATSNCLWWVLWPKKKTQKTKNLSLAFFSPPNTSFQFCFLWLCVSV